MKKRKFQNTRICWEETVQDNKFYLSFNDGLIPSKEDALFIFTILYRDALSDGDGDVDVNCEYDESRNHMVVVVKDSVTHLMPSALMRTRNHMPMPSFPMNLKTAEA